MDEELMNITLYAPGASGVSGAGFGLYDNRSQTFVTQPDVVYGMHLVFPDVGAVSARPAAESAGAKHSAEFRVDLAGQAFECTFDQLREALRPYDTAKPAPAAPEPPPRKGEPQGLLAEAGFDHRLGRWGAL